MSTQRPDWWDWLELDNPITEPMRLRKYAPEYMKKKFAEWQKIKENERAKGIWK